jgi:hypothetical protein
MTNLLHRNYTFVTIHNKFSKISPLTSTHFANRVGRLRVVRFDLHVLLRGQQHANCERQYQICHLDIKLKIK